MRTWRAAEGHGHMGRAQFLDTGVSLSLVRFYEHMLSTIGARCQMCKTKVGEDSEVEKLYSLT